MEDGEWIWADSAYPIDDWVVAPYKKPKHDEPLNAEFNNHLSIIHIRSEHAIGFLKGCFQSLKDLHMHIKDEASHKLATYWVGACIGIYSFAMQCEAEERANNDDGDGVMNDPFIAKGLSLDSSDSDAPRSMAPVNIRGNPRLQAGKAK
ncbi:hypothetical protein Hypma_001673 [Hypsizygus marmoreus]|uniref:DDE Tnp4 domain-containing protein n=1 Tax=Hypsizygus marmoreus TaxID=39966 RepID=A0A369JBM1_HYPMA|nr:hypothetical protein Hypma_001673 [Hypsizygus marmoreus]